MKENVNNFNEPKKSSTLFCTIFARSKFDPETESRLMDSDQPPLTPDDIETLRAFDDEWDIGRSLPGHIPHHVAYSLCERGYMERIKAGRAVRYRLTEAGKRALL